VLFGLKDWALRRWDAIKQELEVERRERRRTDKGTEVWLNVVEQGVQTSFYVRICLI
jgi:hypothetical protein